LTVRRIVGYASNMATVEEQLQALVSRVEALAAANEALRAQLDAARGGLDLTMRGQGRCRACGGSTILHVDKVADRDQGTYQPMSVAVTLWLNRPKGTFETYICMGCGLVEWYVKDPGAIERDGELVRPAGEGEGSPYR